MGNTGNISSKVRNEIRMFTLSTFIEHNLGIPTLNNKAGRRNKRNTN
jgi:hypothetical protein